MQMPDAFHVLALIVGFILKALYDRFGNQNQQPTTPAFPQPLPTPAPVTPPAAPAVPLSLPSLLENPQALQLLRELLHATPPPPRPTPPTSP